MEPKEWNREKMDAAAIKAESEFPANGSAKDVVTWWAANYKTAGHKRLGRVLVKMAKAEKTGSVEVAVV